MNKLQGLLRSSGYMPYITVFLAHEILGDSGIQHLQQWVEKTAHVEYHYRIEVSPQLLPGDYFQQLLQCTATTW